MVVAWSYKLLWPKIDFLIFLPHFPLSMGHFFQHGGQVRKMQKKIIFFAEMAFTHVGTKYIKRPWDFENILVFWCTLLPLDGAVIGTFEYCSVCSDWITIVLWGNSLVELIIAAVSQCFPYNLQRFPIVNAKVFSESKILNAPIFFVVQGINT